MDWIDYPWTLWIIAGLPALYYGGKFWAEVLRRVLALACLLVAFCAAIVGSAAEWLLEKLGFEP